MIQYRLKYVLISKINKKLKYYSFFLFNKINKQMGLLYWVFKQFSSAILSLYFRKIHVVGRDNVPESGPIIICGNHANQFVDPLLIGVNVKQQLSFTMAASSFTKPIIGVLAKSVNSIPVKRPEDHKIKGTGKVRIEGNSIIGINSKFLEEGNKMGKGWSIMIKSVSLVVKEILDNEKLIFVISDTFREVVNVCDSSIEYEYCVCNFIFYSYKSMLFYFYFSFFQNLTILFYLKKLMKF